MQGNGGNWNRHGRKSGGNRPVIIQVRDKQEGPVLSIQCFEGRHGECQGTCKPFFPADCGCACHAKKE